MRRFAARCAEEPVKSDGLSQRVFFKRKRFDENIIDE
jgi:hypothetical protein